MIIYKYDVPDEMILRYCRILKLGENGYSVHVERARSDVHNEIFDHVDICRDLHTRDGRNFNTALNKIVAELTYDPR